MDAIQALVEILTNVKVCKLLGSLMPSKLWLKSQPNVKLRRLLSRCKRCHPSSGRNPHKRQSLQAAGQFDALQALVEVAAQRQTPQAAE